MIVIRLADLTDQEPIIAGSATGRRLFAKLMNVAMKIETGPTVIGISFAGISIATSSCLRECVIEFRRRLREMKPHIYPVLIDLSDEVEEELGGLLNQVGEAIWVFKRKGRSKNTEQYLIGRIDSTLKETLDLIRSRKKVDAQTLWRREKSGEPNSESIGVTAWNNRLATLSRQGLVIESREGKTKIYHSLRTGDQ